MDVRVTSVSSPSASDAVERSSPGGGKIIYKAVVVEFLNDPSFYTQEKLQEFFGQNVENEENDPYSNQRVSNAQFLNSAPRNSCVVQIVTQGMGKTKKPILAFPFFPPHLCFPAKTGEQVWVISESTSVGELVYWMCRVPEALSIDDANYTHGDRKLVTASSLSTSERLESNDEENENKLPSFPNGGESASSSTLKPIIGTNEKTPFEDQENSYDVLVSESESYLNFVPEIVPRLTKRPGDMVLQGSNNTAIILGEDRGWDYESDPASSENSNAIDGYENTSGFKGTIDIVAGRGRFFNNELIAETTKSAKGDDPENTQPRIIANERKDETSYIETDKNTSVNDLTPHPPEGDPDLVRDCSRIYVSMKTNGDKAFGVSNTTLANSMNSGIDSPIEDIDESPFVVMKSDEVRIIATKNEDENVNGTIRIIKQGTKDDDLATICLLSDGTVQISGSKIYLGRSTSDGGAGGGPGAGESQPYVKYQDLENLWNSFMDEMSAFCDTVLTHTTPGYGAPSPQLNQAVTKLKTNIASKHKPDIVNVKSERIFGE